MLTPREAAAALDSAFCLARFDAGGLGRFDGSAAGAMRSFHAALLVAPVYALFVAQRQAGGDSAADPLRVAAIESIAYVIAWVAFPLVMAWLAPIIDRERRYLGFVAAYNWCQVPQYALHLGVALAAGMGAIGDQASAFLGVVAFLYVLGYTWFVVRGALEVSGFVAAGIVGIDFLIGILIKIVVESRLQ